MNKESVNIRPYEERDAEAVRSLVTELQHHVSVPDEHRIMRLVGDFDSAEHMAGLLKRVKEEKGIVLVAESGGSIVGCVISVIFETKDAAHNPTKSGHVEELVVADGARGKGVGGALMEAIESWFKEQGCTFARMECFVSNEGAHAFYTKLGYKDRYVNMIKPLS